MTRTLPQRLIALVCLVAFGLGQTVFASMAVRCRDASGQTRIELGCAKTVSGACVSSCDGSALDNAVSSAPPVGDHELAAPTAPCQDEPLTQSLPVLKSTSTVSSVVFTDAFLVAVLTFVMDWDAGEPVQSLARATDRDRPPDEIARLRTVILIV